MSELMDLQRAQFIADYAHPHTGYCIDHEDAELILYTVKAAHRLEQQVIDLLDDNENLDHSNKMLRDALKAAREALGMLKDHQVSRESAKYAIAQIDALGEK